MLYKILQQNVEPVETKSQNRQPSIDLTNLRSFEDVLNSNRSSSTSNKAVLKVKLSEPWHLCGYHLSKHMDEANAKSQQRDKLIEQLKRDVLLPKDNASQMCGGRTIPKA